MSATSGGSNLATATKDLANAWEQTKSYWRDVKSQEFERKYIEILPGHVSQAMAVIEEINQLLKKVRSDCE